MQHTKEKTRRYFPRPSWRRPRPAVLDEKDAWIQEKGRAHHPAFAAQSEFDLNENRYITYEEKATRHLEQLLRSHDAEMPDEPKVYECSWEVVFQALSQAKSAYVAGSHFGRRAGMGMDLTLGAVQALPDEFGLGAIKGVLALIFQSVNRGIENRDKILDAFDSIPETIVTIHVGCQCLKPTEGDLQLKSEFYSALINGLPFLIDVLLGKQPWYQKVRRFFTLRIEETAAVDEVLAEWKGIMDSFQQRLTRMRDKVLGEIHQQGVEHHTKLGQMESMLHHLIAYQKQLAGNTAKMVTDWHRSEEHGAGAMTALYHELQALSHQMRVQHEDNVRLFQHNSILSEKLRASREGQHLPIINELELLGILHVQPDAAWRDLDLVLKQSSKFDARMLGKNKWLIRTDEYMDWFGGLQSSILWVEGYLVGPPAMSVTPMSIFNSIFISSLLSSPDSVVLFFFAGLHVQGYGSSTMDGPVGLVRTLIMQLLTNDRISRPDPSLLNENRIAACEKGEIQALCGLFENLVLQIPPSMQVYCILDGIIFYESHPWDQDFICVLNMLEHIVRRSSEQTPVFRVLITFAHHSLLLQRVISPHVSRYVCLSAGRADPIPTQLR